MSEENPIPRRPNRPDVPGRKPTASRRNARPAATPPEGPENRWTRAIADPVHEIVRAAVNDATRPSGLDILRICVGMVAGMLGAAAAFWGATIGARFQANNEARNTELKELEVIEQFLPYLTKEGPEAGAALIAIRDIAGDDTAAKIGRAFPAAVNEVLLICSSRRDALFEVAAGEAMAHPESFALGEPELTGFIETFPTFRTVSEVKEVPVEDQVEKLKTFTYTVRVPLPDGTTGTEKREGTRVVKRPRKTMRDVPIEMVVTEESSRTRIDATFPLGQHVDRLREYVANSPPMSICEFRERAVADFAPPPEQLVALKLLVKLLCYEEELPEGDSTNLRPIAEDANRVAGSSARPATAGVPRILFDEDRAVRLPASVTIAGYRYAEG